MSTGSGSWPILTPVPMAVTRCERYGECTHRHDELVRRVDGLDTRTRIQGESIAALKAQVAMWAAFGAIAGGGLVSAFMSLVMR